MKIISLIVLSFSLSAFSVTINKAELQSRGFPKFSKLFEKKMARVSKLLGQKNYDKATSLLGTLIKNSANKYDKAEFYASRGRILAIKGKYAESENSLKQALALKSLNAKATFQILEYLAQIALNQKKVDQSIAYIDQLLSLTNKPSPKTLVLKTSILAEQKKYKEALALVNKIISLRVTLKEDWMSLFSAVYVMAGKPAKAIPFLKKLLVANPQKKTYWKQLTGVYLTANRPADALSTLRAAYEMGHLKSESEIFQLADLYAYLKIPYSSAAFLEKKLNTAAVAKKSKAVEKIFSNYKFSREIELAEKILNVELKKNSTKKLHYEMAMLRIATQDWKKAIQSLKKSVGYKTKAAQIQFALGLSYYNVGNLSEAKSRFMKAKNLNHKNAQGWLNQLANL